MGGFRVGDEADAVGSPLLASSSLQVGDVSACISEALRLHTSSLPPGLSGHIVLVGGESRLQHYVVALRRQRPLKPIVVVTDDKVRREWFLLKTCETIASVADGDFLVKNGGVAIEIRLLPLRCVVCMRAVVMVAGTSCRERQARRVIIPQPPTPFEVCWSRAPWTKSIHRASARCIQPTRANKRAKRFFFLEAIVLEHYSRSVGFCPARFHVYRTDGFSWLRQQTRNHIPARPFDGGLSLATKTVSCLLCQPLVVLPCQSSFFEVRDRLAECKIFEAGLNISNIYHVFGKSQDRFTLEEANVAEASRKK